MKKLILALFLVCLFAPIAKAEVDAYFRLGKLELTIPIKNNLQVVSLYDIWKGEGLIGGETSIASYGKLNASVGAVSSFLGHGTPYVSIDYDFGMLDPELAYIGIWAGRDFESEEWRVGLKSSTKLW
jgi:hypothetical protein